VLNIFNNSNRYIYTHKNKLRKVIINMDLYLMIFICLNLEVDPALEGAHPTAPPLSPALFLKLLNGSPLLSVMMNCHNADIQAFPFGRKHFNSREVTALKQKLYCMLNERTASGMGWPPEIALVFLYSTEEPL
jgi:hypothetical protein